MRLMCVLSRSVPISGLLLFDRAARIRVMIAGAEVLQYVASPVWLHLERVLCNIKGAR
jgi:hypothetical protein